MTSQGQETEVKFYVLHLDRVTARLQDLHGRLVQPRLLETNIRFDLPDRSLTAAGRVLRLRYDTEPRLTYKGAGQNKDGILDRQEIEFIVEDHTKARQFLEALGYRKSMYYEKYRSTYEFENALVMLDELPYGDFVEIEGETVEQIQAIAAKLNMTWGAAVPTSYTALFDTLRQKLQLSVDELSFDNFKDLKVSAQDLNVHPADE